MSARRIGDVLQTPPEEEMAIVCEVGNAARVDELLEYGVNPDARVEEQSYLYIAVINGHQPVMNKLLRGGATTYRLHLLAAIRGGNYRCADRILDELHYSGMELDLDFLASELLYERKVAAGLPPDMFRWLKRQGVDLAAPDRLGRTILELARLDRAPKETLAVLEELTASDDG